MNFSIREKRLFTLPLALADLHGWLVGEKFVELRGRGLHKDGASTP